MIINLYPIHNQFKLDLNQFNELDPHLRALSQLKYQYYFDWWRSLPLTTPGIYILTGGRQIGKSTSCKLLIKYCLENQYFSPNSIFYLPCDEIFDAKQLSEVLRTILVDMGASRFLLIIDEITYVKDWDRVIKALADEGYFQQGICLLTGSDTLILKEAAMRFPGRRGTAAQTDFHLYPLSFVEYVKLQTRKISDLNELIYFFNQYLLCGGYLRAINDLAQYGKVTNATFLTYEQWLRGDFLKQGKHEETLLALLRTLLEVGVSQISYSALTQKMGLVTKETCIDYCRLLERMDILFNLQAFDQNKKLGFPRKARKFHFFDPFIYRTCVNWLTREGYAHDLIPESTLVEAIVASHCYRNGKAFYFKGEGEIDVIWLKEKKITAIEIKWSTQLRPTDIKMLRHYREDGLILTKNHHSDLYENIKTLPVYQFLFEML
jgi:predicted AAA+ superfamily ATPase